MLSLRPDIGKRVKERGGERPGIDEEDGASFGDVVIKGTESRLSDKREARETTKVEGTSKVETRLVQVTVDFVHAAAEAEEGVVVVETRRFVQAGDVSHQLFEGDGSRKVLVERCGDGLGQLVHGFGLWFGNDDGSKRAAETRGGQKENETRRRRRAAFSFRSDSIGQTANNRPPTIHQPL